MNLTKSHEWANRLRAVIPWGSSTCSKAARFFPEEPGVIVRGEGCRVWDADGREYIDYRNALGPVTLGYRFPAVDQAIIRQLENGIIFGHPHPLEGEVAGMLCECIPCAGRVRFLKTGGEAIAACIRLARSHTGRDHVVQIGYNGWLNSLSGGSNVLPGRRTHTTLPGIPRSFSVLHHTVNWNDEQNLKSLFSVLGNQIAAVVVASDYENTGAGKTFFPFLHNLTTRYGSILIFDEIVTGFRVALGGVQEYFGVTPDLAVFAKGVANGMPLSVYAGKAEIMEKLDQTIVSSTYGGETLSLAAAKASIETYRHHNVVAHLWAKGKRLVDGLNSVFKTHGLPVACTGYDCCPKITFSSETSTDLPERFFRAAYRAGVAFYSVAYINFSHQNNDIDETLERINQGVKKL